MDSHFEVSIDPSQALLVLRGECDMDDVVRIQEAVDLLPELASVDLVIDVGGLTYVGSAGLSELVRLHAACASVVLRDTPPQLARLIEAAGLDATFGVREPVSD